MWLRRRLPVRRHLCSRQASSKRLPMPRYDQGTLGVILPARYSFKMGSQNVDFFWLIKLVLGRTNIFRSLQHSMANFYREFPQLRCTELQLKMRLSGLHLQLERVAQEQNTRLAVSSRVQRGSVADKWVFWEGLLPFEVAAGRPIVNRNKYLFSYFLWLFLPNFSATSWADIPNWPQMASPSGSQPGLNTKKLNFMSL